jgi:hypothetical protein
MATKKRKTATVVLDSVKEPDAFGELIHELGLSDAKASKYFEFGEYAAFELEIDEDMNVIGGKVLKR